MTHTTVLLDPTDERSPITRPLASRPPTLAGPIGIVDISKARGDIFCDELERLLSTHHRGLEIVRFKKPTFTKPSPPDLREQVAQRCKAVIQALAD